MNVYVEITVIILIAAVVSGIMRLLKQPLIMGHIITGILVGPQLLGVFTHKETIEAFSQIGISILLFIVGLSLSPKIVKEVGKIAVITGIGQVLFTSLIGFFIAKAFGYSTVSSLYVAVALTFSSTIIITKLLSDKKDLEKLYGRIAIGFLLVQDLIATAILIFVSAFSNNQNAVNLAIITAFKGFLVTLLLVYIAAYVLPKLSAFFAQSQEYLFLFSIAWGLGMATLFSTIGFSIEIGALLAGVTLSISPYASEIGNKVKPLRDFFIIMFFILLGSNLEIANIGSLLIPAALFSLFVLFGNPLIVMMLMGLFGYNKKTGFMAGLTVAQISEFSLILVLLGVKLGHVDNTVLSLVTIVGLITIAGSTYLILYSEQIFNKISPYISIFERKKTLKEATYLGNYDVVLFGCNRVGYDFIKEFKDLGPAFLAVDFDPHLVRELSKTGVNCKYGDAEDSDFIDELNLENTKILISTIPDFDANNFLLTKAKKANPECIVILISYNIDESIKLYEHGATYVIMPHFIGGQVASNLAKQSGYSIHKMKKEREAHLQYLKDRKLKGHAHPKWSHN